MRVQTEEWQRFVPGSRMYKGKKTLFYNGEKLHDMHLEYLVYDKEERQSWEVIMVLPGVEEIPLIAFCGCENIKSVIMADTVRRIEMCAFECCHSLEFVKLSRNLQYLGQQAFRWCKSLTSIYIPPSCTVIDEDAFICCEKLIILVVPQHAELGNDVVARTALGETDIHFNNGDNDDEWIKDINQADEYALHRACSSFNPLEEIIHAIVRRQGLRSLKKTNNIGITPLQYLEANPYTNIQEKKIMKQYLLDMMGALH